MSGKFDVMEKWIPFLAKRLGKLREISSRDFTRRLATASFWSLAGAVGARLILAGTWILLARVLGTVKYGQLGMVQSTVNMFAAAAALGLGVTATKHVAEYRNRSPERAGRVLGLCLGLAVISSVAVGLAVFASAEWLASDMLLAPELTVPLQVAAIALALASIDSVQKALLMGFGAFKSIAGLAIVAALVAVPAILFGAIYFGVVGALVGMVVAAIIGRSFGLLLVFRQAKQFDVKTQFFGCLAEKAILWKFSLPSLMSSLIIPPLMWYASALFARQPGGFEQLGIFTAAVVVRNLIVYAGSNASAPLLPMIAERAAGVSHKLEATNVIISWAMGILMAIPVLCFPEVTVIAFGKDFSSEDFVLVQALTVVSACIIMYKHGLSRILIVRNMVWFGVASNVVWGAILVFACHQLLPLGALGLALAYLIAYVANSVLAVPFYFMLKVIPTGTIVSRYAAVVWLTLGGLVYFVDLNVSVVYRALVCLLAFIAVGWAFAGMTKSALGDDGPLPKSPSFSLET
ncbi:MAG: oligosaccharide flippase family protein [Planctomycetaceae bacterium]|nr:oligosaccharide flippase family protein [Planctomycetaceae bacterium]